MGSANRMLDIIPSGFGRALTPRSAAASCQILGGSTNPPAASGHYAQAVVESRKSAAFSKAVGPGGRWWFPYAAKFQERHQCRLSCAMSGKLIPLFRDAYPDIEFLTQEEVKTERYYATYGLGLFFDDKANVLQPCDFRHVGLHRTAGYILGVDPTEVRPRLDIPNGDERPMAERYVCIATRARPRPNTGTTRTAGARSSSS
jgi:hypothetical protein